MSQQTQPLNNPVYHRRVACDQTISFHDQRYPVPFEVGALVLVERLLSQNALRIQPLHEGRPDISASFAHPRNRRRIDHAVRTYTHSGNSTRSDKTPAYQSDPVCLDEPLSTARVHTCNDKTDTSFEAAWLCYQPA
ncbi:MAG: hypothetical protein ACXWAT_11045 [Methylobacter sp.]